ncbi:hypothetical protein H6G04_09905 [Calothrix membranacea FACHB-236]|nr:hypothetical protein [Calothrix membranacea FACHB-236]
MNSWHKAVLENLLSRRFAVVRWLITFLLVLSLASCGDKAVSQDVAVGNRSTPQQSFKEFAEVSPPATIEELRSTLDIYQPQVAIVTPQADEVLSDNQVTVRFQVKDLPIFKDPKWELGPHLHVILDNQPYIAVYDLDKPLVFSELSPGTHSLRVFASRPWHESFKNEGAYAQIKFHILARTDDNNPDPALPVLTYSRPKGDYGAEPILLDFYLTNAPLHLVSQENSNSGISDWRIRCTINGESFVLDRWQAVYLTGFKPGKNWVKLEFLDNQGNPVKNVFNTTVGLINYQPKGKDTLSRIVSGELKADDVRGIVDPNYTPKPLPAEPAPSPEPTPETKPTPAIEIPETPITEPSVLPSPETSPEAQPVVPSPAVPELPEEVTPQPEKAKGGYFKRRSRPTATPSPSVSPTLPETIPTPAATESPQPQVTPTPAATESPQPQVTPTPAATESPQPQVTPTPTLTESPQPQVTPTPTVTESPQPQVKQRTRTDLSKYFQRRPRPTPETSPTLPPTLPEIIEPPARQTVPSPEATPTPAAEDESAQE